jgi:hypothetical protein
MMRLLYPVPGDKRKVITHHIENYAHKHQNQDDPETPIMMRTFPVWTMAIGRAAIMGVTNLIIIHMFRHFLDNMFHDHVLSIAALYSPRRAAQLHLAR